MKDKVIMAAVMAAVVCGTMASCGDSSPKNEQELESKLNSMSEEDLEKEAEKAAESIDAAESNSAAVDVSVVSTEESVPEIVYEPTDEIINAEFSSGLIQIGNDVFKNGGYYTLSQFIDEFGDRYDMSEINTDGLLNAKGEGNAEITSLEDASLKVKIYYVNSNKEETIKVGEAIVYVIETSSKEENCWYPKGIRCTAEGYDYDNIPTFLEDNGYKLVTGVSSDMLGVPDNNVYGAYWEFSDSGMGYTSYAFKFNDINTEKNLLDSYPMYKYEFWYNMEDAKAYRFYVGTYPDYIKDLNTTSRAE